MLSCKTVASDIMGGEKTGIFKAMKVNRTLTSFGVLSSWSWACSKIMDYIYLHDEFDKDNVAVIICKITIRC